MHEITFRYRYHFPFLDLDGFTVDDNRVGPLYKHVFPPKYAPNLSFVGLPYKVNLNGYENSNLFQEHTPI
jgi:hypothetical protein